jgi:hypothetical protein
VAWMKERPLDSSRSYAQSFAVSFPKLVASHAPIAGISWWLSFGFPLAPSSDNIQLPVTPDEHSAQYGKHA